MTPIQFYQTKPKERVKQVAEAAKTTFGNFKQIALAGGSVGKELAERLAQASNGDMSELEILYPERFQDKSTSEDTAA